MCSICQCRKITSFIYLIQEIKDREIILVISVARITFVRRFIWLFHIMLNNYNVPWLLAGLTKPDRLG